MQLSLATKNSICDYFLKINDSQNILQTIRQSLNKIPRFHPRTCFNRINRFQRNQILAVDLLFYLDQLYVIFKDIDSKKKGSINVDQFSYQILSKERTDLVKEIYSRQYSEVIFKGNTIQGIDKQSQFNLCQYLKKKKLRQNIHSLDDFKIIKAYKILDQKGDGKVSIQQFDQFFRKIGKNIQKNQIHRIFRVLNQNQQGFLSFKNFAEHFHPFEKGYYKAYLQQLKKRKSIKSIIYHTQQEKIIVATQRQKNRIRILQLQEQLEKIIILRKESKYISQQLRKKMELEMSRNQAILKEEIQRIKHSQTINRLINNQKQQQLIRYSFYPII